MSATALRFAVIGSPVAHSRSPAMHAAAYRALGLPHTYEAVRAEASELPALVRALREGTYDGLNVTVPHKQAVLAVWHAEPEMGRAVRTVEGIPVGFRATRDGRARVVFSIADGTEQIVVFERIDRIIPR